MRGCQKSSSLVGCGRAALFGDEDLGLDACPLESGLELLVAIPTLRERN